MLPTVRLYYMFAKEYPEVSNWRIVRVLMVNDNSKSRRNIIQLLSTVCLNLNNVKKKHINQLHQLAMKHIPSVLRVWRCVWS